MLQSVQDNSRNSCFKIQTINPRLKCHFKTHWIHTQRHHHSFHLPSRTNCWALLPPCWAEQVLWQERVCMNTLPYTASCASNRLLTLLCKLNVNVERVLVAVLVLFCGYDHTANPEEVCVVKGNTLPDIQPVVLFLFSSRILRLRKISSFLSVFQWL